MALRNLNETATFLHQVLGDYTGFWAVAGGWAIDFYLGELTRKHKDLEIAIWRDEQEQIHRYLAGWDCKSYNNGYPKEWLQGNTLHLPVHEVHCLDKNHELEILLNERENGVWTFRRDKRITSPERCFAIDNSAGVKVIAPEIVLLYKAKDPSPNDILDLENTLEEMEAKSRTWLFESIYKINPKHKWLSFIGS